jgi:hypothetical protein
MTAEKREATPAERDRILRALESGGLEVPIGAVFPTLGPEQPDDWDLTGLTVSVYPLYKEVEDGHGVAGTVHAGNALDFAWQSKRNGFGHITFRYDFSTNIWRVDTEDMSRDFVIDVFTHWLKTCFPDIRPRINPDPHHIK